MDNHIFNYNSGCCKIINEWIIIVDMKNGLNQKSYAFAVADNNFHHSLLIINMYTGYETAINWICPHASCNGCDVS